MPSLLEGKLIRQKSDLTIRKGNENLVSNENNIEGSNPEILNSSVETEKLPNDKTLSVNENTPTSEKRIARNISRTILTPSDLKRIFPRKKER